MQTKSRTKTRNYGTVQLQSPVMYWSEFENLEETPYTVDVTESTSLIPWFHRKPRHDRDPESQSITPESSTFLVRVFRKLYAALELEIKTSADGLTTLFYEKHDHEGDFTGFDDDYDSESDSSDLSRLNYVNGNRKPSFAVNSTGQPGSQHGDNYAVIPRSQLLNRGYCLCVLGCMMLLSTFGTIGVLLDGEAAGVGFILVGFLISMTLELVSLVRFIMYDPFP